MRMRALLVVLTAVLTAGVACSGSDEGEAGSAGVAFEGGGGDGGSAARDTSTKGTTFNRISSVSIGPRVIKTADLSLEVGSGDLDEAVQTGITLAQRHGGFVHSTTTEGGNRRSARMTLRIPAGDFEAALAELRSLGSVDSETVSGEDVSQEFVDLEARTRNLEAQETVMLRLMGRAKTVAATIQVQRELEDIQLEIEQLRGRMRFLRDQTALSTISLRLTESGAGPVEAGLFDRAKDIASGVTSAMVSGVVLATGALLPIALFALALLVLVRLMRPVVARLFT